MSNKPEEDEATAARASPDIKPILAPPIPDPTRRARGGGWDTRARLAGDVVRHG